MNTGWWCDDCIARSREYGRLLVNIYEIASVEDRWYEPDAGYFKVGTTAGKTYLLRYDEREDVWSLQSGFDGDALLARPNTEIVAVDPAQVHQAESRIEACEPCHPDDAEIPFDWILGEVTGREKG